MQFQMLRSLSHAKNFARKGAVRLDRDLDTSRGVP